MTVRDLLIPALQAAFPDRGLRVSSQPEPIATFPAANSEVGDVLIYDEGREATVLIENVTHHHVNPYDESLSKDDRCHWISEEVVEFLYALFSDQILLWSIDNGRGGGGWRRPFEGKVPTDIPAAAKTYVWSGPLKKAG